MEEVALFEQAWFKWVCVSSCVSLSFGIAAYFFFQEAIDQREHQAAQRMRAAEVRAYEEEFRSTMVRVYQNLRLEHFLAAFKNLDQLKAPDESTPSMYRDYHEAMARVAVGLLEDKFLDESEGIFQRLQVLEEYEELSRNNLVKIASARRFESANKFLELGIRFIEEKKFIDAANELRKAKLEFDSVALYQLQDVQEELDRLGSYLRIAKYHVHRDAAQRAIDEARRLLKAKAFAEAQQSMAAAAGQVGRAAFYSSTQDPEVKRFRGELLELNTELAFQVPNAEPTFNFFSSEAIARSPHFFYLKSADLEFEESSPEDLAIRLNFEMKSDEENYYVFRYKAYFFNGKMYFNGQKIVTELSEMKMNDTLPPHLKGQPIKRLDLSIYNQDNVLISRITRAFRKPSAP